VSSTACILHYSLSPHYYFPFCIHFPRLVWIRALYFIHTPIYILNLKVSKLEDPIPLNCQLRPIAILTVQAPFRPLPVDLRPEKFKLKPTSSACATLGFQAKVVVRTYVCMYVYVRYTDGCKVDELRVAPHVLDFTLATTTPRNLHSLSAFQQKASGWSSSNLSSPAVFLLLSTFLTCPQK